MRPLPHGSRVRRGHGGAAARPAARARPRDCRSRGRRGPGGGVVGGALGHRACRPSVRRLSVLPRWTRQRLPEAEDAGQRLRRRFREPRARPRASAGLIDDAPAALDRAELAVVADAVSTAYQALRRADVQEGDAVFVVGAGGVGGYAAQIARALGAHVIAIDVDAAKLEAIARHGAEHTVASRDRAPKEVRKEAHAHATGLRIPSLRWRTSSAAGPRGADRWPTRCWRRRATLVQVGYTPAAVSLRLSNSWPSTPPSRVLGLPPGAYPDVLRLIYGGQCRRSHRSSSTHRCLASSSRSTRWPTTS